MTDYHIFFDTETTGLGKHSEIIQIGAICQNGEKFNTFIVPAGEIEEDATEVNGFTKRGGKLFRHGQEIREAVSPRQGLRDFLDWVKRKSSERVILIAHNGFQFDAPILINNIIKHNVETLDGICRIILGFGDTLKSFRERFPVEPSYKQENLMEKFGMRNHSHDALDDANNLMELVVLASDKLKRYGYYFITKIEDTKNIKLEAKKYR